MVHLILLFSVWSLIFSHQHLREPREGGRIKGDNVARTDKRRGEGGVEVRGEKHDINCQQKCLINVAASPTFVLEYITRASRSSQAFTQKKKKVPCTLPSATSWIIEWLYELDKAVQSTHISFPLRNGALQRTHVPLVSFPDLKLGLKTSEKHNFTRRASSL